MIDKTKDDLLTRGISAIYPSKEFVEALIKKGKKLTIYLGIDPTGPTLHLGHAIVMKKLSEFQKEGHKIILLMGDFTAMIGDPTDKTALRKQLTRKEVLLNMKSYKKQASKILSFKGKNPAVIKFNSKWLSKMNFEDVLSLASQTTVQQMLERDMFEKRMGEGKPIFLHEFMYPLMQGYDSVAMNIDGEIGGNDQTFNMLCGRDLMKNMNNKEKFVITTKLLEDNSGKKMGKTENNMVSLSDSAENMYGKVMSWSDNLIIPGFELCTNVSMDEVEKMATKIAEGVNPRDLKMRLAKEITSIYHGDNKTKEAEENFVKTFQKNEIPDDVDIVNVKEGDVLVDVLLSQGLVSSKTEFRRLVDEGAIKNLAKESQKISNHNDPAEEGVYKIGKKRFIRIKIN